jgi:hypothetical protein
MDMGMEDRPAGQEPADVFGAAFELLPFARFGD